jgi:hypothetical protein
MDRRAFLQLAGGCAVTSAFSLTGCRGRQYSHILDEDDEDLVGSHEAGAAVYEPLVKEAVSKLLGDEIAGIQQARFNEGTEQPKKVCFIGVENDGVEEIGDFKNQLFELIDASIVSAHAFDSISRRYVDAGLKETRIRPEELFLPRNQREFTMVLEQAGQPFDYMLFARLTTGTTRRNDDKQRDYLLTLELVNVHNGRHTKQQAKIRKGYHPSVLGRIQNY